MPAKPQPPLEWTPAAVIRDLRTVADPKRAEGEKRYLKSDLDFVGVAVPVLRRTAKRLSASRPEASADQLIEFAAALWAGRWHELRSVGMLLLELHVDRLRAKDLATVEDFVRRGKSWVYVDLLSIRVAGPLMNRFKACRARQAVWARDDDFWIRRAALLVDLLPLRDGTGDFDRWSEFAISMLGETEFFIRKAIGWVLRESAKSRPELTLEFVDAHRDGMSGLTIREATKNLA